MPEPNVDQHADSRVIAVYDRMAPRYDRAMSVMDRLLFAEGRLWAARRATGRTLEIGVGTGRNLPFYSPEVELTGIDTSPAMLARARQRAAEAKRPCDLRLGDAQALDFPDGSFDTVLSTCTLCTIPDPTRALLEAARVLRPGGLFVCVEHVRSPNLLIRFFQRVLDPLFVRFCADHLLREPVELVKEAGLDIVEIQRLRLGIVERLTARRGGASHHPPDHPTPRLRR